LNRVDFDKRQERDHGPLWVSAKVLALTHFSVRVRRYGRTPERRPAGLTAKSARRTSCRLRA
jgi:hypothetical protein